MDTQDYFLSPMRRRIIETLFVIRGANADVLSQFIHEKLNYTPQEKKQIINQLHRLKEKGILTSKKLEGKYAGSMYFLSVKGFELAKKLLDIKPLQRGSMWLKYRYPFNSKTKDGLRDYDYDSYKPPIRQHKHHHLILRSIVSLFGKESNLKPYSYRLTLDSFKKYIHEGKECVLKPDGEFSVDKLIYTLEIDRSTESYAQLVQKFRNYKHYLEYEKSKEDLFKIHKIIFVIDDTERDFGMSRRWGTIFKAYLEGMGVNDEYSSWPKLDIILTTVSEVASVVEHDIYTRTSEVRSLITDVFKLISSKGYLGSGVSSYYHCKSESVFYFKEQSAKLIYTASYPYYTSAFYRYLTDYYSNAKAYFKLPYGFYEQDTVLISKIKKQNWLIDWGNSNVDRGLKDTLDIRFKLIKYLNVSN